MDDNSELPFVTQPLDAESRATLAGDGLELRLVDASGSDALHRWQLATARGFHDPVPGPAALAEQSARVAGDRVTAVYDPTAAEPLTPVGTARSWPMGLTVPGGGVLPAWAISSVTVAPTHRRRGIARAMLTAELRTARALGLPMAMLTVSEATIYGRYGFGPAAHQASVAVTTAGLRWSAPPSRAGRVQLVTNDSLLRDGPAIFARARARGAGEVDRRPGLWRHLLGLAPLDPDTGTDTGTDPAPRAVRFDDAAGTPQGFALYRVVFGPGTYPARLDLVDLVAATDDAYAALWRFLLEIDLVGEVTAPLRSTAEPLAWLLDDPRAVRKTDERDHLWLRLVDVPVALEARRYAAPGAIRLDVADDLGLAGGGYLLTVAADGCGSAHPLAPAEPTPSGAAHLELSAASLAALYLGGPHATVLARAGLVTEHTTDAAAHLDAAFHSGQPPHLSSWF